MKKTVYIYFSVDIVHKKCQKESHEKYKSDEIKAGFGIGDVQSHMHDSIHALNVTDIPYNARLIQEKDLYKK